MFVDASALTAILTDEADARAGQAAETCWQLRYEIGQLRVHINRLESEAGLPAGQPGMLWMP